jgi:DNA-binding NarL/FixJ family response regulator
LGPDLVVLDVDLPFLTGLEVARKILAQRPRTSVLILTEIHSEGIVQKARKLGVRGFVLKSDPLCDLVAAAEAVLQGRTFFTSRNKCMVLNPAGGECLKHLLTLREREVVHLLAEGHRTKDIARILALNTKTVEAHRHKAMRKLNINSTAELVLYALQNEITEVPSSISKN